MTQIVVAATSGGSKGCTRLIPNQWHEMHQQPIANRPRKPPSTTSPSAAHS
jgi:hypothetical protein